MQDKQNDNVGELERLSQEIALLREQTSAISNALNRIEKRLKLAYPSYTKKSTRMRTSKPGAESKLGREELMRIYGGLVSAMQTGGDSAFATGVQSLAGEDLVALAVELGVTDRKKIGVAKAREGVRKRVHESLLLGGTQPTGEG